MNNRPQETKMWNLAGFQEAFDVSLCGILIHRQTNMIRKPHAKGIYQLFAIKLEMHFKTLSWLNTIKYVYS